MFRFRQYKSPRLQIPKTLFRTSFQIDEKKRLGKRMFTLVLLQTSKRFGNLNIRQNKGDKEFAEHSLDKSTIHNESSSLPSWNPLLLQFPPFSPVPEAVRKA
jgi:hypothetical protein